MSKRDEPAAKGNLTDPQAHTVEQSAVRTAAVDTPNRIVVRSSGSHASEDPAMIGADTAVASPSQQMAALSPAEVDYEDDPHDTLIDTTLLDRYRITKKIGQGGMGAVYEATHTEIGKRIAVKVLLDKYAEREQIVKRLKQEAVLASSIRHEHIIDITDFGTTQDGRTFVVMEYLEGESLAECLLREGPFEEQRVIHVAHQTASALGAAHKKGVIHRDIKPDNVFLVQRKGKDFVKVVDFGISKSVKVEDDDSTRLTQTGMVLGTPLYMSPEQARGDDELDHRIDIYALGVIMYELVTGELPFRGNNYLSIISQVINDEPAPPSQARPGITPELEAVIMRALAKDRNERYGDMDELTEDLEALRAIDGNTTGRPRVTASRFWARKKRKRGKNMLVWGAFVAGVVAAVAVAVVVMMSGDHKSKQAMASPVPDAGVTQKVAPIDAGPAKPAVAIAEITIVSNPKGATIYADQGGQLVGKAPAKFRTTKADKEVWLIAELPGHNDTPFKVNPYVQDGKTVRIRLKKPKKGKKATRIRRRKPTRKPAGTKTGTKTKTKPGTSGQRTDEWKPSPYD